MHRLFVAIRPPVEIRAGLLAIMTGIIGARWQDDDQLHLTLRFVGEVDRHLADDLADTLSTIDFAPFDISLSGFGSFERKGHVDTLWAAVHPRPPLENLHQKIDRACVNIGLPPDKRAYLPHITLARLGRGAGSTANFLTQNVELANPTFTVERFSLFESRLGHAGAAYHEIESYHSHTGR